MVKIILFLIGLILLTGGAFRIRQVMRNSLWDGRSGLVMAFNSQPLMVYYFQPEEKKLSALVIPDRAYLEVIHGYGFYQARSLWKLGEMEKNFGNLFRGTLQEYLALPVEGWLTVAGEELALSGEEEEKQLKAKRFLTRPLLSFRDRPPSNLSRWDLIRLWWQLKGVKAHQVKLVELEKTGVFREEKLADGTVVLAADQDQLDQLTARYFSDQEVKKESVAVGVYNATDYPGLANQASRLISNLGGRVMEVSDWKMAVDECLILGSEDFLKSRTFKKIKEAFHCRYDEHQAPKEGIALAVILGDDYWRWLNVR